MLKNVMLVGLGGFAGSVARYLVALAFYRVSWMALPLGTLTVNVLGSLLIGLLLGIADRSALLTLEWRLFLMVGLCGGFTTFSSFTGENLVLLRNGQILSLLLYTGLSLLLGFAAVYLGYHSSKLLN